MDGINYCPRIPIPTPVSAIPTKLDGKPTTVMGSARAQEDQQSTINTKHVHEKRVKTDAIITSS